MTRGLVLRTRSGVVVLSGFVTLGFLILVMIGLQLRPGLSPEEAEGQIRASLESQIYQENLLELRGRGRSVPDSATAWRWLDEVEEASEWEFTDVRVRRAFFTGLASFRPCYYVRVRVKNSRGEQDRYFRIRGAWVQETSKFAWDLRP